MEDLRYDVVVAGGGTAGVAAGIAAARLGARTLIVERYGSLGGTQSNGWVTPMMPNYLDDFKLNRGVNLEIVEAQAALQPPADGVLHGDVWYDPIALAGVLDEAVRLAGCQVLFDAVVVDADVESRTVLSIDAMTRGGRLQIRGASFVDTTGDAELSRLAGAELMGGNEGGVHQPMTLRFTMGGLDLETLATSWPWLFRFNRNGHLEAGYMEAQDGSLGSFVAAAIERGILEPDDLGYFQVFTMNGRPGELAFNCPRIAGLDPLDPFELSEAYRVGRAKIARVAAFVRGWFPGCAGGYVSGIAPLMGIRESRRVVGEYVLTASDHASGVKFDDVIARNRYPVDIHLKTGVDFRPYAPGEWHDVPYRSLVVRGFDNLWVAGRCLSADFVAQSAVRIQPVCRSMGEAAGYAAALCARSGHAAATLPYADLATHLDLELPAREAQDPETAEAKTPSHDA